MSVDTNTRRGQRLAGARALLLMLRLGATRTGPRLARGLSRCAGWLRLLLRPRSLRGLIATGLIWTVLGVAVAVRAWVSHPRWSRAATGAVELLWHRRVVLAGLVVALAGWLLTLLDSAGAMLAGTVVMGIGMSPVWLRLARAVYPHTRRGRVRTRYGLDGFADHWELRRHLSAHAARHVAVATRPSLLAALPARVGPDWTPGERPLALMRSHS